MKRKFNFKNEEYYHLANYGIENLSIFKDGEDFSTFLKMLKLFNNQESLGSSFKYNKSRKEKNFQENKIVEILAYALINNHFHLIIQQKKDKGIVKFMQRLATGYAMYFNKKYQRRGSVFISRFSAQKIENEDELEKNIIYVNLNYQIHKIKLESFRLISSTELNKMHYCSSQDEYLQKNKLSNSGAEENICQTDFILKKYTPRKYKNFSESIILDFLEEGVKIMEIKQ